MNVSRPFCLLDFFVPRRYHCATGHTRRRQTYSPDPRIIIQDPENTPHRKGGTVILNPKAWSAVKEVIHHSIGWAMDKDVDLLYRSVARDADFFIFHPDSRSTIRGFKAFQGMVEKVFMNDAFKATGFDVRDLAITFSESGSVAWFSAILDDHGEWDGTPSSWTDTRWTGVLEKRDAGWVIVQMHFSFASDSMEET